MTEKEFEGYWLSERKRILSESDEYRRAKENFKISTGADWLLFGIPIVAGIVAMSYIPLQNELLKWLVSACVTIVCFVLCVWVKSITTGTGSPDEIEKKLKNKERERLVRES